MMIKTSLEYLSWSKARIAVASVNSELAALIDTIDPPENKPLIKATFPFGTRMIVKGKLQLPNKQGQLVPLGDPSLPTELSKSLSYNLNTNPVSVILQHSAEIYLPQSGHTISLNGMIKAGSVLSTSRILSHQLPNSPAFIWEMSAGARSIFMLPKIAEEKGYRRLRKRFGLSFDKPHSLNDQWELFKKLLAANETHWATEILYFPHSWVQHIHDPAWAPLRYYLLQQAWDNSEFWRNQFVWDMAFSLIQEKRCLKVNSYIADTVKHLLFISAGVVPAFAPATTDQVAPISTLQTLFSDIYKLDYYPTLMQPTMFTGETPVYYSLEYPSLHEFSPRNKIESNKLNDLYETKLLIDKYVDEILANTLNISDTQIYKAVQHNQFAFFHTEPRDYEGIMVASLEGLEDPQLASKSNIIQPIAFNSTFLRGCIQIRTLNSS